MLKFLEDRALKNAGIYFVLFFFASLVIWKDDSLLSNILCSLFTATVYFAMIKFFGKKKENPPQ